MAGWLAEIAVARATALIWLDLPFADCLDGLSRRGLRQGETEVDRRALIEWAGAYDTRATSSSHGAHEALFGAFAGTKRRLMDRREASELIAGSTFPTRPSPDHASSH